MPEFLFDNFILRPFRADDPKNFFELVSRNKERLEKYFPITVRSASTIESTRQYVQERIFLSEKLEFISFVIVPIEKPAIIGLIFLKNIDWNIPKCEIGFFIDKQEEGKGIVSNAVRQVVRYAFDQLKLNKLFMRVGEDNPASQRVGEKCGFILEGKLRNDFKTHDGKLLDVLYYGLTPKDISE